MTKALAKTVSWLHLFCIVYLVFGFLSPKSALLFHLIAIPVVILQWRLNKDQCVLTQLQKKLESSSPTQSIKQDSNFTKELFLKWGIELSNKQLFMVIYGLLSISWMISFTRWMSL